MPAEESEPFFQGDSSYGNLRVKNSYSSIPREVCALVFSESGIADIKPKVTANWDLVVLWFANYFCSIPAFFFYFIAECERSSYVTVIII